MNAPATAPDHTLSRRIADVLRIEPDSAAIEYDGTWCTWRQLSESAERIRETLGRITPGRAPRVGMLLRNRPVHVAALLGVLLGGGCVVVVNPSRGDDRTRDDLRALALPVVVGEPADLANFVDPGATTVSVTDVDHAPVVHATTGTAGRAHSAGLDPTVAILMLTSGTTGPPKRVALTYDMLARSVLGSEPGPSPEKLSSGVGIVNAPLVHIGGVFRVLQCIVAARPFVLLARFELQSWTDAVRRYRPRAVSLVPAAVRAILHSALTREDLDGIAVVTSGTAPLSADDADAFTERFGIPVLTSYAATEFGGGVAGWTLPDHRRFWATKRGSVGRAQPGSRLRVVDEGGTELPAGEVGLLEVKPGQLGADAAWIRTTDLGRLDDDGFLWIVGRADQAVIRGGFKVLPEDVRVALESHPDVLGAAVIGRGDDRLGEVPVAMVELRSGGSAGAAALTAFLSARLARYEIPTEIAVVSALPRTPSGKADLSAVRAHFDGGAVSAHFDGGAVSATSTAVPTPTRGWPMSVDEPTGDHAARVERALIALGAGKGTRVGVPGGARFAGWAPAVVRVGAVVVPLPDPADDTDGTETRRRLSGAEVEVLFGAADDDPTPGTDLPHLRHVIRTGDVEEFLRRGDAIPTDLLAAVELDVADDDPVAVLFGPDRDVPGALHTRAGLGDGLSAEHLAERLIRFYGPDDGQARAETAGTPPGAETRIVDPDTGDETASGAVGELWVRGAGVMLRHVGHSREQCFDPDGWWHTSDLVRGSAQATGDAVAAPAPTGRLDRARCTHDGTAGDTIPLLLRRHGATHPDRPMAIDTRGRLSYRELDAATHILAATFVDHGVGKGTRVGVLMPNGARWITVVLALARVGAVAVPLSTLLTPRELRAQLATASVRFLVSVEEFRGRRHLDGLATELGSALPTGREPLLNPALPALRGVWTPEYLLGHRPGPGALALVDPMSERVTAADDLVVIFTSGSSGSPKGVLHSHGSALAAVVATLADRCIGPDTRLYLPMPFFWVGGFGAGILSVLAAGATLVTEEIPTPESTLELLERERVTLFRGWPDQAQALAAEAAHADLSSLRPGSLEALLPPELRSAPGARANLFGMTESFGPYSGYPADTDMPRTAWGSCGRPVDGVELRIVDTRTGEPAPAGTGGEIQLRGTHLLRGICRRRREDVFTPDGFYRTGDLGRVDEDGFLFYRGRSDDMFKVSGATVYPSEVQAALRALPGVRAAFVTGLPGPAGDRVAAVVVGDPDLTPDALRRGARGVLSAFKVPSVWRIVDDDSAVPRGATGKVDPARLREMLAGTCDHPLPPAGPPPTTTAPAGTETKVEANP